MLDGVSILRSEKVKDELVLDGNLRSDSFWKRYQKLRVDARHPVSSMVHVS
jgi:hypothetical protein